MMLLSEPVLGAREAEYLDECVRSGFVSSAGPFVAQFEETVALYCGAPCAVALQSGTAALHLALLLAGIGPGDEVIVPTLTFVATVNPVRYTGARPVFVDVDQRSWNLDPDLLEPAWNPKVKAVIPVHLFGFPAEMERITDWARRRSVIVIEDATESLGSRVRGRSTGSIGDFGCLSFNGNKIVTTGGGGMILTNCEDQAARARWLSTQARDPDWEYTHPEVGYNYRMVNTQAALGLAQMERLGDVLAHRQRLVARYRAGLADLPGVGLPPLAENVYWNGWLASVLLPKTGTDLRPKMIESLATSGIQVRPFFKPLHHQPPAVSDPFFGSGVADNLHRRGLNLPSSFKLNDDDVDRVIEGVRSFWDRHI